ncbi:MAG: hypothetical protein OQK46_05250 [Gammaproteobacteria bacterium]|nr:hypothetical protein [Gammaproteobacteria bacterium]
MSPVIRLSSDVYKRLERHASGFDTPANVIEKLLNHYEGIKPEQVLKSVSRRSVKRHTRKYIFNGKTYGKGRLVLAVVKAYMADHPETSFVELSSVFPEDLQGSSGVFVKQENALEIFERTGHKRHFIKPDELVQLDKLKVAVSTEWSVENIGRVIEKAESFGYSITETD